MRCRLGLVAIGFLAAAAGCAKPIGPPQFAPVSPLPSPSAPAWISQIAPLGRVPSSAQVRVIFASPVLPVGQLGTPGESAVLSHFHVDPALPGQFVVLTPRMIGFESVSALPKATRVRVTLTSGLRDLRGDALVRELAWTFETDPLVLKNADENPYADSTPAPVALQPVYHVAANARLNLASLIAHAAFRASDGSATAIAAKENFDADSGSWEYDVWPHDALRKAEKYELVAGPGVLPASGNVASAKALRIPLRTYSPFTLISARPTADPLTSTGKPRFSAGDPVVLFNNALDPKALAHHVAISPAPRPVGQLYSLSYDGATLLINPYALTPRMTYRVAIDANLQDIYGQKLGQTAQETFATGDLTPYFWAPSGFNMFVASQNLQLQYEAINLPGDRYGATYRTLDPAQLVYTDETDSANFLPSSDQWAPYALPAPRRNAQTAIEVPLRDRLGAQDGLLAYGARAKTPDNRSFFGTVELTNLGVFAQWFGQSGSIMVQHLSDGSPVPGASIQIYISHLYDQQTPVAYPAPCASGTTDAGGVLQIQGTDIERCYAGNRPADEAPELLTVARSGADWSYVRTFAWSGAYDYTLGNADATWSNGQPLSRGIIYSDRQLYQPGERAWLTAVCYVLQSGALRADSGAAYSIVLQDPNGGERKLAGQTTNRYATFSFPLDLSKSQPLGYYTVTATSPAGAQMTGSFRVAEFRPPNFSVDLTLNREFAAAGDTVAVAGNAQYLYGAPMGGATGTLHVTRQPAAYTPKGWDSYTFGRQWFWPEQQPDVSAEVSQRSVTLDAAGKGGAGVTVARDLPYAMTYRVDLEVTDVSHLASSATRSFTALPSDALIGLQSDFVGTIGKPLAVAVIVTDPAGKVQSGTHVHLELQKMQYSGVTQIVEGAEAARNQVQYTTVAQADVTSSSGPQSVTLLPTDPGSYRIRANFTGAAGDTTATDTQVWVSGPGQAIWGQQNPTQLQMKLDKSLYAPGDTANVAIASPYERADLYLSVVRDRVLYKKLVHINGSAPRVRIPVTRDMFPNAAVEGVLVRRGASLTGKNVQRVDSLVRIGMVPLSLNLRPSYLSVTIDPALARLEPRRQQHVRLLLRDRNGRAVPGQFTVIVANDAILQLSGYRPPDLVQTVLAAQPISTRFADNRPNVTLTQPSDVAQKGWGYGGGFLAGAAGTRVRTQFVPLAYFNGSVQTDAKGRAEVSFTVPDNLTTWRVMAVAVTAGAAPRFGNGDTTFITTKPLVTDPLLPQFARTGDRFDAGLLLMNDTTASLDARTQGNLAGALSFGNADGQVLQAQQSFGPGAGAWRFPMIAGTGTSATVQFRTFAGSSDAFRVPLEIRNTDVTESTIDSGATKTAARVPLQIGSTAGSVSVEVAGSILPQVAVPARQALQSDDLTLSPSVANRLNIAASVLALQQKLGTRIAGLNSQSEAAKDIGELTSLQRIDGGFAFWPGAHESDPFGSADAVRALAWAQANGLSVSGTIVAKAKPYLVAALADPKGAAGWCESDSCKASLRLAMLRALAALGDRRSDFLQSIFAQRNDLGPAEEAALAVYLQQTPGWRAQADTLAGELAQRVYLTGRYANIAPQGPWYGSSSQEQAAYLQLLVARGAPADDKDRALRALIAQSCRCGWPSLSDTADALQAIVAYAQSESSSPNFTAMVLVDGKTVGTARFASYASASKTFTLASLAKGAHELVLRKGGSGTLHYIVSYTYRLDATAPGRVSGLRIIRSIHPANQQTVLATVDIAPHAQPLDFPSGNVYDIAVEIAADHPVDRVVISDPLPAGFEALDTTFQTTPAYYQPLAQAWEIDYQQIYHDRITAFAQHLDPGVYMLHYLVRSVTPGEYLWPGASAYLLNAPEQFGRSAFRTVRV